MLLCQPRWIVHADEKGRDSSIFTCHIHPDGTRIATGALDSYIKIWNVSPVLDAALEDDPSCHKLLSTLAGHNGAVLCVRWSSSGAFLATGSDDTVVMIWQRDVTGQSSSKVFGSSATNHEAYRVVKRLADHTSDVTAVAWDRDDTYIASGGLDNMVLVYDARSFQCIRRLAGHTGFVKGVCWDPIGEFLASQSDDKTVKIWRTNDWALDSTIEKPFRGAPTSSFTLRLSWSPDGTHIVTPNSTNHGVFVAAITSRYDWSSSVSLVGHPNVVEVTAFNPLNFLSDPNGSTEGSNLCALLAVAARNSVSFWITSRPRPLVVVHEVSERDILDMCWSSDGRHLFCASSEGHIAVVSFDLAEFPPVVPNAAREEYQATFGFKKPWRPAPLSMPSFSQTKQIRTPSPQKTTIVNGKRRIQPSLIATLFSDPTPNRVAECAPTVPKPRPPLSTALSDASLTAALEARMTGSMSRNPYDRMSTTTTGFHNSSLPNGNLRASSPPASVSSVKPRASALLIGPDEDAGDARLLPPLPRGHRSRAPGQSISWTPVDIEELEPAKEWTPLALDDIKLEVPAIKSFASVCFQADIPDTERLEWRNYMSADEPSEIVQMMPDRLTPLWLDYVPGKIILGALNSNFSAVSCSDAMLLVYSPSGRHILPPLSLDSPCAFLNAAGAYLLAVTASGRMHVWNVMRTNAAIEPFHLHALLRPNGGRSILSAVVRPNGTPVVTLSDGNAFAFDSTLKSWILLSATPWFARGSDLWETRARGRTLASARGVVRHLEGAVNDLLVQRKEEPESLGIDVTVEGDPLPRAGEGKADYAAALALGHAEARLNSALSLGSHTEYKLFLAQYAQRIADEGFRAKGEELVRELLGPVYLKAGRCSHWSASVLGLQKRDLLRDVLNIFAKSIALKKLANDTQDLLRKVAAEE